MELSSRVSPDLLDNQFTPYVSRYDTTGHAVLDIHAITTLQQYFMSDVLIQCLQDKYFHALYSNFVEFFLFHSADKQASTSLSPDEEALGTLVVYLLGLPLNIETDLDGDEFYILWGIQETKQEPMEEESAKEEFPTPPIELEAVMEEESSNSTVSSPTEAQYEVSEAVVQNEEIHVDESKVPSGLVAARKLATSRKGLSILTHGLIHLVMQLLNAPPIPGKESFSPLRSGLHQIVSRMLSLISTASKYDSIRASLEKLRLQENELDVNAEEKELISLVIELYHICLRILRLVRDEERKIKCPVFNVEEPFEMLMKRLLQCMPMKLEVERK